jgi:hypothetical protein
MHSEGTRAFACAAGLCSPEHSLMVFMVLPVLRSLRRAAANPSATIRKAALMANSKVATAAVSATITVYSKKMNIERFLAFRLLGIPLKRACQRPV